MSSRQQRRPRRSGDRFERRAVRSRVVIVVMVGLMVLSLMAGAFAALLDDSGPQASPDDGPEPDDALAEPVCPPADGQLPEPVTEPYERPPRFETEPTTTYVVALETTCGDIRIEVDTEGAPRSSENFLALVDDGYYDGTPFHRIVPGFVVQGGDPTGTGTGCVDPSCEVRLPGYELEDELETARALPAVEVDGEAVDGWVRYPRGTVAMANAGPDTQGAQFFVVQAADERELEPAYTIVGQVVDGMDVVDDIAAGPAREQLAVDPVVVVTARIDER